jgi:hypothetical protein
MHLESGNATLSDVVDLSQLVVVETQVMAWKPHNHMFICWGFFIVNNGLPMDLLKLCCDA